MNTAHLILFFFNRGGGPTVPLVANPAYTLLAARRSGRGHVSQDFPVEVVGDVINMAFDATPLLGAGETILSAVWSCAVVSGGADPDAAARIVGSATITGAVVIQKIGSGVAGVTYRLAAVLTTSAGQTLTLWSHCVVQAES